MPRTFSANVSSSCLRLTFAFTLTLGLCLSLVRIPCAQAQAGPSQPEGSEAPETRVYYVAAEPVTWNYVPSGADQIKGVRFDTSTARFPDPLGSPAARYPNVVKGDYLPGQPPELDGIGPAYQKVLYRAYTDSTFTERKPRPPKWEHLGTLGPVLRAEVGDTIKVVFKNKADRPYSIHPSGVSSTSFASLSTGSPNGGSLNSGSLSDSSGTNRAGTGVPPGSTRTYTWPVPERAGPGPSDPSSVLWMYYSDVRMAEDMTTGLIGPMIITERGMAGPSGTPTDVDREIVTMFSASNETDSGLIRENIRRYVDMPVDSAIAQPAFEATNRMQSINGYVYGNMPRPTIREGERVRWYVFSGSGKHTVHWHANTVLLRGRRTDMIDVGPMMKAVADMVPDNPGIWLLHCHVDTHFKLGMSALYEVRPKEAAASEESASAGL
jgi:FtsP/CotA-like multicopper oxidase with cupredoxin domain